MGAAAVVLIMTMAQSSTSSSGHFSKPNDFISLNRKPAPQYKWKSEEQTPEKKNSSCVSTTLSLLGHLQICRKTNMYESSVRIVAHLPRKDTG
jgi:hypothetical protein